MSTSPESPSRTAHNGASLSAQMLLEQLARVVLPDLPVEQVYAVILERLLAALHASAGAVWLV